MNTLIAGSAQAKVWNIKNYDIDQYWQSSRLSAERLQKLSTEPNPSCEPCRYNDSLGNQSKRVKENYKSVIFPDHNFDKSFEQSPDYAAFEYSKNNQGRTMTKPLSYHVSLGNDCNLACIMCSPHSSYKLAQDYKKLNWITEAQRQNWTDDSELWEKFMVRLLQTENLLSFHVVGGEPTITPRFYELIDRLVQSSKTNFSFSFTTNGMQDITQLWPQLSKFDRVEIGISIETIHKSNDYIRYGSDIEVLKSNIDKFINSAPDNIDFVIRTVPTFLTITQYASLIDYCREKNLLINSYFITTRDWQAIEILPQTIKQELKAEFQEQLNAYQAQHNTDQVRLHNFRNKSQVLAVLITELRACIQSLSTQSQADLTELRTKSVKKISELDRLRGNSVLDSFPRLKEFFISHGYQS
jgi:MoaA/NifB/PqqE/SkfB family radical SAM enzyme